VINACSISTSATTEMLDEKFHQLTHFQSRRVIEFRIDLEPYRLVRRGPDDGAELAHHRFGLDVQRDGLKARAEAQLQIRIWGEQSSHIGRRGSSVGRLLARAVDGEALHVELHLPE
jgi:hypothetical protein